MFPYWWIIPVLKTLFKLILHSLVIDNHCKVIYLWFKLKYNNSNNTAELKIPVDFFYPYPMIFFIAFRERGREREKYQCDRETSIGCLPDTPRPRILLALTQDLTCLDQGSNWQPGHVPWPGTEPTSFQWWGDTPTTWVTLARAKWPAFNVKDIIL